MLVGGDHRDFDEDDSLTFWTAREDGSDSEKGRNSRNQYDIQYDEIQLYESTKLINANPKFFHQLYSANVIVVFVRFFVNLRFPISDEVVTIKYHEILTIVVDVIEKNSSVRKTF